MRFGHPELVERDIQTLRCKISHLRFEITEVGNNVAPVHGQLFTLTNFHQTRLMSLGKVDLGHFKTSPRLLGYFQHIFMLVSLIKSSETILRMTVDKLLQCNLSFSCQNGKKAFYKIMKESAR